MNPQSGHVYFATISRSLRVLMIVAFSHFGHVNCTLPESFVTVLPSVESVMVVANRKGFLSVVPSSGEIFKYLPRKGVHMKELMKLILIPVVGCVAIACIFIFVVYGGKWERIVENPQDKAGLAVMDLDVVDATIQDTGICDPSLYTPVCGFDGKTYDNPCLAVRAGTRVSHRGICQS